MYGNRGYTQVKRELWGIISAVKVDKDYLIGTKVIVETDCLLILGMVSGCATPDLAMLRWIAYIKSFNPEIRHISRKDNAMADMLSRARFENEDGMVSEDEEGGVDFFKSVRMKVKGRSTPPLNEFDKNDYDGEWLLIGRFRKTMTTDASWTREEASQLRKRAYRYFLRNGKIWKHPKRAERRATPGSNTG